MFKLGKFYAGFTSFLILPLFPAGIFIVEVNGCRKYLNVLLPHHSKVLVPFVLTLGAVQNDVTQNYVVRNFLWARPNHLSLSSMAIIQLLDGLRQTMVLFVAILWGRILAMVVCKNAGFRVAGFCFSEHYTSVFPF